MDGRVRGVYNLNIAPEKNTKKLEVASDRGMGKKNEIARPASGVSPFPFLSAFPLVKIREMTFDKCQIVPGSLVRVSFLIFPRGDENSPAPGEIDV